ncbi:hypothetical protein BDF14DRAFT_1807188 [Spinellus fusiger]|nr:hypothetical protein BDF14DRAFT_1807188 [Spinellus fusiger]
MYQMNELDFILSPIISFITKTIVVLSFTDIYTSLYIHHSSNSPLMYFFFYTHYSISVSF